MSFTMCIERGKVREFARAAQSTDAAYDQEHAVVPPTFLTTARLLWRNPGDPSQAELAGLDRTRTLHGSEEFVFHGEVPRVGDILTVETGLVETYQKVGRSGGRMTFAVLVSTFRGPDGVLVAEQRSTLIETGGADV